MKYIVMFFKCYTFSLIILLLAVFPLPGHAKVYIDINAPAGKKLPIAIPDIKNISGLDASSDIGAKLRDVFVHDMETADIFNILDKKAYIEDPGKKSEDIDFNDWKVIGADFLVKGNFLIDGEQLTVELKLFDVFQEKLIIGRKYIGRKINTRAIAHKFADDVMEAMTGEKGVFNTRLLFVSSASGNKEIYVSDYDGYNAAQVTKNNAINLSPHWSPDGKKILYTSYKEGQPYLYMLELTTNREIKISSQIGVNIGARWSPLGKEIALTLSKDGNPELYVMRLDDMKLRRLTNNWAIDVSPSWSPDGRRLVFVSDIGGNPHIYMISSDGTGLTRLTYEGKYNAAPAWSPNGDKIAFSRLDGGKFDIWVMNTDGAGEDRLTSNSGDNENPSWSPDGRYITFTSTRSGSAKIYMMRSNGENQRQIKVENLEKGNQTAPSWSPYLE